MFVFLWLPIFVVLFSSQQGWNMTATAVVDRVQIHEAFIFVDPKSDHPDRETGGLVLLAEVSLSGQWPSWALIWVDPKSNTPIRFHDLGIEEHELLKLTQDVAGNRHFKSHLNQRMKSLLDSQMELEVTGIGLEKEINIRLKDLPSEKRKFKRQPLTEMFIRSLNLTAGEKISFALSEKSPLFRNQPVFSREIEKKDPLVFLDLKMALSDDLEISFLEKNDRLMLAIPSSAHDYGEAILYLIEENGHYKAIRGRVDKVTGDLVFSDRYDGFKVFTIRIPVKGKNGVNKYFQNHTSMSTPILVNESQAKHAVILPIGQIPGSPEVSVKISSTDIGGQVVSLKATIDRSLNSINEVFSKPKIKKAGKNIHQALSHLPSIPRIVGVHFAENYLTADQRFEFLKDFFPGGMNMILVKTDSSAAFDAAAYLLGFTDRNGNSYFAKAKYDHKISTMAEFDFKESFNLPEDVSLKIKIHVEALESTAFHASEPFVTIALENSKLVQVPVNSGAKPVTVSEIALVDEKSPVKKTQPRLTILRTDHSYDVAALQRMIESLPGNSVLTEREELNRHPFFMATGTPRTCQALFGL